MRNVDVLVHNEFVDVVPTFLLCFELIDVELMFPPMICAFFMMLHT